MTARWQDGDSHERCPKTVGNLIDKQGTVFIISVDSDGFPDTKAMFSPRKRERLKVFYFSTNTSSLRVAQYRQNPKACVYACNKRSLDQENRFCDPCLHSP